jgi:hypothetical protein
VVFYNSTVICSDRISMFAILQSSIHIEWVREYGSTLKGDARYAPERCFEPFPFPNLDEAELGPVGENLNAFRSEVMRRRGEGLTKIYNRFHDIKEQSEEIAQLRMLQVEMDRAVAAAYGWLELELDHGFHETKQGMRFTISDAARRTVLDSLLTLNQQRYDEEVRTGLREKKTKPGSSNRKNVVDSPAQAGLY